MTGNKAFMQYVKRGGKGTIAKLARATGIDDGLLSKLARGQRKGVTIRTATKIDNATGGEVPISSWLET